MFHGMGWDGAEPFENACGVTFNAMLGIWAPGFWALAFFKGTASVPFQ